VLSHRSSGSRMSESAAVLPTTSILVQPVMDAERNFCYCTLSPPATHDQQLFRYLTSRFQTVVQSWAWHVSVVRLIIKFRRHNLMRARAAARRYHYRSYRALSGQPSPELNHSETLQHVTSCWAPGPLAVTAEGARLITGVLYGVEWCVRIAKSYQSAFRLRGEYKAVATTHNNLQISPQPHQFSLFTLLTLSRLATPFHPLQLLLSHHLL